DGLRTAVAIREFEKNSDQHTPIVAVTAHALASDREACLSAGMDAYLAKPLDGRELIAVVEGLVGVGQQSAPEAAPAEAPAAKHPAQPITHAAGKFDVRTALARMEDDLELFGQLAQFFLEDGPSLL